MAATISMYLGEGKYWWAYLALKSNAGLLSGLDGGITHAIFFDEPYRLPAAETEGHGAGRAYLFVFWDGVSDYLLLDEAQSRLGAGKKMKAVVVGDFSGIAGGRYEVESLYPEGVLRYNVQGLRFEGRTTRELWVARVKTWLMPLKNILQGRKNLGPLLGLLFGGRRIVFCGSYGTIPKMLKSICERRGLDFKLFEGYAYYGSDPVQSLETYRRYVDLDGVFLADLYRRGEIDATFFLSAFHLLGREFFIERFRAAGLKMFANAYATGINVNVYTTPFYAQHVFPDFGSVVGSGNYPRLADLAYFKKKTIQIHLEDDAEKLVGLAEASMLNGYLDALWDLHAREIEEAMR